MNNLWRLSSQTLFTRLASLSFMALLFSVLVVSSNGFSAHATSVYDDIIRVVPTAQLTFPANSCTTSYVTDSWYSILTDPANYTGYVSGTASTYISTLNTAVSNTQNYALLQGTASINSDWQMGGNVGDKFAVIVWSEDSAAHGQFSTTSYQGSSVRNLKPVTSNQVYYAYITFDMSCNVRVGLAFHGTSPADTGYSGLYDQRFALATGDGEYLGNTNYDIETVFNRFTIDYPVGYSGVTPPLTPAPAVIVSQPVISNFGSTSSTLSLKDSNFNTVDPVPFTCNDGTAPVMITQLFKVVASVETLVDSRTISPTTFYTYTMPPGDFSYSFTAYYDCGTGGSSGLDLSNTTVFTFAFTSTATSYSPQIHLLSLAGFSAVIQDLNFNTFDPVPFTCNGGTTPIMRYQLTTSGNVIDSGTISPTVQYSHDFEKHAANYSFNAWYDCGSYGDGLYFGNVTVFNFSINDYGSQNVTCGSTGISDFYCTLGQSLSIGILSTTFNGITTVVQSLNGINPSSCNTAWASVLPNQYLHLQDMPLSVCSNSSALYLTGGAPFNALKIWLNVLLSGASIMFLTFGVLSLLGVRVRMPGGAVETETQTLSTPMRAPSGSKATVTVTRRQAPPRRLK